MYPHNNYYFSLLHLYYIAFWGSSIPSFLILKCFVVLVLFETSMCSDIFLHAT